MSKYKSRLIYVEAYQWFKNGDHPEDNCVLVEPDPNSTTRFEPFLSEGKVVRRYRHPSIDGHIVCQGCKHIMNDHGWIDASYGGWTVCPGNYVIKTSEGVFYTLNPTEFEEKFEKILVDDGTERKAI